MSEPIIAQAGEDIRAGDLVTISADGKLWRYEELEPGRPREPVTYTSDGRGMQRPVTRGYPGPSDS